MNGKMKIKPNVTWASGLCLARTSLLLILICAASISCTRSKGPQIQVNPNGSGLPMSQKFSRAYCSMDELGDYQFVLIADGNESLPRGQGKILYPTNSTSLRQVVYIRVLWKPLPGTRADQPTSTNATINWYVRSNMPDSGSDKLDYGGAGFVAVYPTKTGAHVIIRNADLAVRQQSGEFNDPLGRPSLTGSFDAVRNDGLVRDILASITQPVAMR
jgi:hypothetical protein